MRSWRRRRSSRGGSERRGRTAGPNGGHNLQNAAYRKLTLQDLFDIAVEHGLHFDQSRQEGVTFDLIGALSQFGKLGVVAIGRTMDRADALYARAVEVLDRACS